MKKCLESLYRCVYYRFSLFLRLAQSLLIRPSRSVSVLYLVYIDASLAESTKHLGQQLLDSFLIPEVPSGKAPLDVRRLVVPLSAGGLVESMLEHVSGPVTELEYHGRTDFCISLSSCEYCLIKEIAYQNLLGLYSFMSGLGPSTRSRDHWIRIC